MTYGESLHVVAISLPTVVFNNAVDSSWKPRITPMSIAKEWWAKTSRTKRSAVAIKLARA